jgi:hypothetical protein
MGRVRLDPAWAGRRSVVRYTLISCLGLAVYSMYLGPSMAAVVFPPVSFLAGGVIGSYVFGASWERTAGIASGNTLKEEVDGKIT